ncbi:MAG: hypothetical protein J6W08_03070 [Alphaproteobacteria bacterium]|nr:hypothetical protein [Alphaproteobacteria bacterium]
MKIIKFLPLILICSSVAYGAVRGDASARVGVGGRGSQAGARMSVTAADVQKAAAVPVEKAQTEDKQTESSSATDTKKVEKNATTKSGDCREDYRECMNSFCLLEESQGERCACSNNINSAKSKIKAVLDIQAEADKLFTEGVERENLGAKARLVFTDNNTSTKISSTNFLSWVTDEDDEDDEVGEDVELGDELYEMAQKYCASELKACGDKAEMEEQLYSRMIIQDCKNYDAYLKEQKANAESNKRIAESAVRKARLENLGTTNKYNRGECLLAYRSCIADKGGCGTNFENCLDAGLLKRRSNACENILDQCMAVRDYVVKDWADESRKVLEEAAKYADKNRRGTCLAKVQECLEENCSTATNAECLTNVNVAAGICPVITECDEIIPGFQSVINDKLGFLQTKFCENDVDKCLQDKCGVDFTKPECVGKKPYEIAALCPQDMFPSCRTADQFDIIVQSAILQMDYQMLQGCVNYFGEQLGKVCGTDMACLPIVTSVTSLTKLPTGDEGLAGLRKTVIDDSDKAVEEFFAQFEQDKTVAACADSQSGSKKLKGKVSLGTNVFNTAKLLAKMSAEQRNLRELDSKIAELAREKDLEEAKQVCLKTYKAEKPEKSKSNYSYIKSVSFEPDMRNCHVCRIQQVCEEGGESKAASALKAASGGLAAGASMGTMVNAGWGTAIGGVVGAVGAGALGAVSGGKKDFCQELESCEDINM